VSNRVRKPTKRAGGSENAALPLYCDFGCSHAGFAPADATGACRRDQAVWCALFKKLNNKHSRCLGRK
jgi:hypothetical protein